MTIERPEPHIGKLVRDVWIEWAKEQPDVDDHPSWLVPWEELPARDREVDIRIGQQCRIADRLWVIEGLCALERDMLTRAFKEKDLRWTVKAAGVHAAIKLIKASLSGSCTAR